MTLESVHALTLGLIVTIGVSVPIFSYKVESSNFNFRWVRVDEIVKSTTTANVSMRNGGSLAIEMDNGVGQVPPFPDADRLEGMRARMEEFYWIALSLDDVLPPIHIAAPEIVVNQPQIDAIQESVSPNPPQDLVVD